MVAIAGVPGKLIRKIEPYNFLQPENDFRSCCVFAMVGAFKNMKNSIIRFLTISAFATCILAAQTSNGLPPPTDLGRRHVNVLNILLTLTTGQQDQATTIFTDAATAEATSRESLKATYQSLQDAVANHDSAAIDRISLTIGTLNAQVTALEAKADAALYEILTPEQQTKFKQSQEQGPFGLQRSLMRRIAQSQQSNNCSSDPSDAVYNP